MFGASNSSGGSLFGGNANNNSAGGGLFGASKPSGFGSPAPSAGAPAGAGTGGGLFGGSSNTGFGGSLNAPAASQGTTGTGFGGSSTPSGGLFGAKPAQPSGPSGGLFGGSSNAGQQAPSSTSGGLFGGNSSNTSGGLFGGQSSTNNSNSGGLFNKPAASSAGGLFGSSTSNAGGSGGLFGQQQNSQNTQSSAPAGGLFGGNNTSNTQGGGLFGNSNTASTGGLFGQSQQQQQPQQQQQQQQQSGGLFGNSNNISNTAQPSFAWSSQQPPANNNVNNTNTNNNSNNSFYSSNQHVNTANFSNNNASSNNNVYTPAINDQLLKIKEQWDPNSPKCALKTHFYNKLTEQEAQIAFQQQRPANELPEDWDLAMSSRPSPQYYPMKVTSFGEVAQRIEVQLDHVAKARVILKDIDEKQSQISSKHDLNNTTRILKAKSKHIILSRRLLRLATVLAILKLKGYPLLPEEEEISRQFEILNKKLSDPSSPLGKMNDVFAKLAILKDRSEDLAYQFDSNVKSLNDVDENNKGGEVEEASKENGPSNEETIQKLSKLLLKLQIGLNHLNGVLEKDLEVVDRAR
ncbi:nucleoporin Nup57p [[Candida] railenensis]|uniref:Nucleoporin Nup57p n=1 Tax=[Candida] railenensis TaxID=45579 RepID=A0A9P0QQ46_9ASCO|nr:nucleoporin Nup57p [[Candida] railenensis]